MKTRITEQDPAVSISATTSQGKGGQHVNKNMTRAVVYFTIPRSTSLSDEEKKLLLCHDDRTNPQAPLALKRVCNLLSADGVIRVESQSSRSLSANKVDALEKLNELIASALQQQAPRQLGLSKRAKQTRRAAIRKHKLASYKRKKAGLE